MSGPARVLGRAGGLVLPVSGIAILLTGWAVASATGVLPSSVLPSPGRTLSALSALPGDPLFPDALGDTLTSWALGFATSVAIAVPLGIALGTSPLAYRLVRLPVEAMRPVPPVVVLPLALLVLGGGQLFKVALIAQGAVWPLLIQTVYAVRATDPVVLDTARSYRLGRLRTLVQVRVPAAAPALATGARLAAATCFAVCVVSELVGGATGLGNLLVTASSGDDVTRVLALTFVVGLLGLALAGAGSLVERRFLHWAPGRRA